MSNFTAKSPERWIKYLKLVKDFLFKEKNDIDELTIVSRCISCYKKNRKTTLSFKENQLVINDWVLNCNFGDEEFKHTFTINDFNLKQLQIILDGILDGQFNLVLQYSAGFLLKIPLTSVYPNNDYEVHSKNVYKDRNLKMIQRETDNGLIIMFQNFIDFMGLEPRFSETVYIKWKDN